MYASNRITPVQRMRNNGGHRNSPRGVSPSKRSLQVGLKSKKMNGDYFVLKQSVEKERKAVREARAALANSLDQLGEHHVRRQEYDDAMDAFTEALREKRSVFWQISSPPSNYESSNRSSHSSTFSSSLLSGEGDQRDHQSITSFDSAIDEVVNTLRNMGNVHSLRGEQDEAMRYYTEVTSLRAQKSSNMSSDRSSSVESKSLLSGLNDDTSTLMSEINEDVKALDDLFRSISFRNNQGNNANNPSNAGANPDPHLSPSGTLSVGNGVASGNVGVAGSGTVHAGGGGNEKRKSKQPIGASAHQAIPSNKRRKSNSSPTEQSNLIVENEPFKRSTSNMCLHASGNEVAEAMDTYRGVLETYAGKRLDQHKEILNSLALRADLLTENRQKALDQVHGDAIHPDGSNGCGNGGGGNNNRVLSKAADLELALEIYHQVLMAHQEHNQSYKLRQSQQQQERQSQEHQGASNIASTLICMGSIYYKMGSRVEELQMYKEAKAVYRKAFGENHGFVAGTRKNIGMVLAERGEYDEAMEQFEKAMKIYLAVNNGSDMNRDVASAISCMGNVKNRVGELDAALKQYMEALRIYRSLYEASNAYADRNNSSTTSTTTTSSNSSTSSSNSNNSNNTNNNTNNNNNNEANEVRDVTSTLKVIGMVHAKKGDLDTAMGFFQEAMSLLRSSGIDGTTSETTASVLTRIASIHLKKGDLDQAMAHYREAYDLTVRNRGTTSHQEVAGILHYIGGIYHKRADYDEAMACYQEAIRIYHSTLGPSNPTVAGTLVMVGSIYYKRRNLDSAMMFYREALRLNRDAYGMHHPDVAPILKSIGTISTKKGDYHEAYDIFRDVLSIKCTVHGTDHPEVASAYKSLGNVHYKLGDLADAERQYRHALSIYRRTKGEEHADTIAAKTTIEHLRYWMREREQRQLEQRHAKSSGRGSGNNNSDRGGNDPSDERSC